MLLNKGRFFIELIIYNNNILYIILVMYLNYFSLDIALLITRVLSSYLSNKERSIL